MQLTDQELEKIKNLAKQWGKVICKETFGSEGPGLCSPPDWASPSATTNLSAHKTNKKTNRVLHLG